MIYPASWLMTRKHKRSASGKTPVFTRPSSAAATCMTTIKAVVKKPSPLRRSCLWQDATKYVSLTADRPTELSVFKPQCFTLMARNSCISNKPQAHATACNLRPSALGVLRPADKTSSWFPTLEQRATSRSMPFSSSPLMPTCLTCPQRQQAPKKSLCKANSPSWKRNSRL